MVAAVFLVVINSFELNGRLRPRTGHKRRSLSWCSPNNSGLTANVRCAHDIIQAMDDKLKNQILNRCLLETSNRFGRLLLTLSDSPC